MITGEFPDSFKQLVAFGQRPDVKIRPVLLRVLVDMFVTRSHHSLTDLRQFEEMMAHLLDDADDETRLVVAEQLSKHPLTPRPLLERFVAERGAIAAKVLAHAGMDNRALNAAAVFGTAVMAEAVARRSDLDLNIVRSIAERPEETVLCALVENAAAPIERSLFRYLARRAQSHPALAASLLQRGGTGEAVTLFFSAAPAQRATLIATARRQDLGLTGRTPISSSAEMLAAIERAAMAPGLEGLDITLGAALQCTPAEVHRIMDDPHGEPAALALAALGVSPQVAARIFILGNTAISRSYLKVRRLVAITETVSPRAAYQLVAAMLGRSAEVPRRTGATTSVADAAGRRAELTTVRHETAATQPAPQRVNRAR